MLPGSARFARYRACSGSPQPFVTWIVILVVSASPFHAAPRCLQSLVKSPMLQSPSISHSMSVKQNQCRICSMAAIANDVRTVTLSQGWPLSLTLFLRVSSCALCDDALCKCCRWTVSIELWQAHWNTHSQRECSCPSPKLAIGSRIV